MGNNDVSKIGVTRFLQSSSALGLFLFYGSIKIFVFGFAPQNIIELIICYFSCVLLAIFQRFTLLKRGLFIQKSRTVD